MYLSYITVVEKREFFDVVIVVIYGNASGAMYRSYHIMNQNRIWSVISAIPHQKFPTNVHTAVVVKLYPDYQEHSDWSRI